MKRTLAYILRRMADSLDPFGEQPSALPLPQVDPSAPAPVIRKGPAPRFTPEEDAKLLGMLRSGWTKSQLREHTNVTPTTLNKALRRARLSEYVAEGR